MKKILITVAILLIAVLGSYAYYSKTNSLITYRALVQTKEELVKWQQDSTARIERAKDRVVDDLAKCETLNVKNPDDFVKQDGHQTKKLQDKDIPSYGAWQYKISTVQTYYKKLYGEDLSNLEAITVAMTHDRAHELTKRILFEENAASNWYNCNNKLGLDQQIKLINSL